MLKTHGVEITWLGHAAFRMRSGGKTYYIDPFLTPSPVCPEAEKHPSQADFILLTHGHMDHISDAVPLAKRSGAKVGAVVELGQYLVKQGLSAEQVISFNKGGTVDLGGAKVTIVHADHSSSVEQDGSSLYLGEPAGYVVVFPEGLRIYFSGDTAIFGDMKLIGEMYQPEVAVLPIGGWYTMGPFEAAHACRLLGVKTVVPEHFGTWPILSGTPAELKQNLKELGVACEVVELAPGQTVR